MVDRPAPAPAVAAALAGSVDARVYAAPLLAGQFHASGEPALAHADGVAGILQALGAASALLQAAYLVEAAAVLQRPDEVLGRTFGAPLADLVATTGRLVQAQQSAQRATPVQAAAAKAQQQERVRKMLLAFSADLRVVLLRLASSLQTLRWHALSRQPCPEGVAREAMEIDAPLANRLGIWQLKWEIDDLAFRFLEPAAYKGIAALLDERRVEREQRIEAFRRGLAASLADVAAPIDVQARPKHIHSIAKKMRQKQLGFDRVLDLRAVRVVVPTVADCYTALARVHTLFAPIAGEFDDYIARPKGNGYQSLHTVVAGDDGRPVEVQIRTRAMHEHAEHGVAAHWAYKEAGVRGHAGVLADGSFDAQVGAARRAVLLQLLAWGRESTSGHGDVPANGSASATASPMFADHVYVFTPQAQVVELPTGATPIDFAYAVHTALGHRCRGARVDGAMVPLATPLTSGQTVEVIAARDGGPSKDWLNPGLGFLASPRSRAKVRAWFNALATAETVARGRVAVERVLQRLGKTAIKLDDLAAQLGFKRADALFEVVGKDEFSLRNVEQLLRPMPAQEPATSAAPARAAPSSTASAGGVLVVGVDSLLTGLARCCRPAPPDAIAGYVTRGKGVAVHRVQCSNLGALRRRAPERLIAVAWGANPGDKARLYPVSVTIDAADRAGLLRDVSEVFAKDGINVTHVDTRTRHDARGSAAWMVMTIEVADTARLAAVLARIRLVPGVRTAQRL